jgi:transposase
LSELFLLIALSTAKKYNVNLEFSHLDSSSISVHGQYNQVISSKSQSQKFASESEPIPISITHGYSRDNRQDLKQFILDLIVTGDGNIPIFIEAASGNQSDKKAFGQIAKNYQKQLNLETTIVGDSALYSKENLGLMKEIKWLTRVPLSIKEAKNLVNEVSSLEFSQSELPGYSFVETPSNYGEIYQRWLLVESEARAESDIKSLEKKISKEREIIEKKVAKLFKKTFDNVTAAELSLKEIQSKFKYHLIAQIEIKEDQHNSINNTYHIIGKIEQNKQVIEAAKNRAGRFIIATNRLDKESFSCDEMLLRYKEQQNVERGFAFLKDPLFFADSIFLKSPQRIETMSMLMGLCLMVYSLGQREVRAQLSLAKTGIPNQLGKLTARPTLRWIFQCFQGIHCLIHQGIKQVVNLTEERLFILKFLTKSCQKYYLLSG